MYDYGARFYMPDLGRFTGIDALSAFKPNFSPYRFAYDNPIVFNDPTGLLEDSFSSNFIAMPNRAGLKKGEVWNDDDGRFVWDGKLWRDSNGNGVSYKEGQIEEVTINGKKESSANDKFTDPIFYGI